MSERVDGQVAELGDALLADVEDIADQMCKAILAGVPAYATGIIGIEELRQTCLENARLMLGSRGTSVSRRSGRPRICSG